jgi:hypothetical protein
VSDGDDGSFIYTSIICSYLKCKIRFEAPKRQQERENRRYGKDAVSAKLIYNNV